MCWYNLLYITFSRIFEKDVNKEIGLKFFMSVLSPFLYMVFISENFNQQRKYIMKVIFYIYTLG